MSLRTENTVLRQDLGKQSKVLVAILIVGIIVVYALASFGVWSYLQPKGRASCADFGSYGDACTALKSGDKQLDSDHDNKPCEAKFPDESQWACGVSHKLHI